MPGALSDRPEDDDAEPNSGRAGAVGLVFLAAGSGHRSGHDTNKVLLPLAGRGVLTWSLDWTQELDDVAQTIVVVREQDEAAVRELLARESPGRPVSVVTGGATRHQSEVAALRALAPQIDAGELDVVVIHDAARPFSGLALFEQVIDAARLFGGAIPVVQRDDLVFSADGRQPGPVVTVQTPQAFRARPLLAAYEAAAAAGFEGTDTAGCVERFTDLRIRGVSSDQRNLKITYPEDLSLAEALVVRPRGIW